MRLWPLLAAFFFTPAVYGQHSPDDTASSNPHTIPGEKSRAAKIKANRKIAGRTAFRYFIIKSNGNTYGYSIYADGNLYIQQNTVPGLPGSHGFTDTASAGKAARLVIKKIKQGEVPPTININDLKKIGVH